MKKERENLPVSITDSDGEVLFEGSTNDIHRAAEKIRNFDRQNQVAVMFPIPDKTDFDGKQFLSSADLKTVGESLIEQYQNDFAHLVEANIVYLWKEKGGETGGMATLGKCIRPTGLVEFFACEATDEEIAADKVDYVIWAAADHLRDNRANYRTVCALIFHELLHTHWEDGKLIVRGHLFEGFPREIEEFGMWQTSIKQIAEACETVKDVQQGLFMNHA